MFCSFFRSACLIVPGMLLAVSVQAGVVLNTTRVIYPATDKEVSLGVHNTGRGEILLQSWLEAADESPSLPFLVTPPLVRMAGDGRQLLRLIYAGAGMPEDRESVFWLNVQEIPQEAGQNTLQIAVRQRIKVFFRPRGLAGDSFKAAEGLQWRAINNVLHVENPGAFHVSMVGIGVSQGAHQLFKQDSQMLAPGQQLQWPLKARTGEGGVALTFSSIDDFGAQVRYRSQVLSNQRVHAERVEP